MIIATAAYADQELAQLRAPAQDAAALARVLGDPEIGGFAVTQVIDQDERDIRRALARFLHGRGRDELTLVYLSCHGLLDAWGQLYFAATDTDKGLLPATAVESTWLTRRLEECRAGQQILILDCCFSGAFARSGKGTASLEHKLPRSGRGRVVLTASRHGEYSFEGKALPGQQVVTSVFTTGLVEGIATGTADTDRDGLISVEDAFDYAAWHVHKQGGAQTPQKWLYAAEGPIVLARSPAGKVVTPAPLPEHLTASLDSPSPHVRIGVVNELGELMFGPNPALALAARDALERIAEHDCPRVAAASRTILQTTGQDDDEDQASHVSSARDALRRAGEQDSPQVTAIREILRTIPGILQAIQSDDTDQSQSNRALMTIGTEPSPRQRLGARPWDEILIGTGPMPHREPGTRSRGGTLIATASWDKTARTWDTATGQHHTTVTGHKNTVVGVAFSPDGALIATASADTTARIWDTATSQLRTTLTGHQNWVRGVAFSPEGALIATASWDTTARIWDTATGQLRTTLTGHQNAVYGLAFSPEGTLIATASWDKTARTWDTTTGQHRTTLTGHDGEVYGVAYSPDGSLIATASADRTARIWDTTTGQLRTTLTGHDGAVLGVAYSPDGALIATASADRTARIWDTATGTLLTILTGHNGYVLSVAYSPGGTLIATASRDKTARIWDTATGQHRTTLTGHECEVWGVAFSPNGA